MAQKVVAATAAAVRLMATDDEIRETELLRSKRVCARICR